jgi:transposase InsO family protein
MTKALNALGYRIVRRKTRRLMKVAHIFVRYRKKYKVTTNRNHQRHIYENVLQRQFTVDKPNKAYVSDITYIWTQEGWLYLSLMRVLFSRKVVGWHMSPRMTADTVCMALNMAIGLRNQEKGLIVHSDRGSQYASQQYQSILANHGFIGSMSGKGDCWDNSVAESFLAD